MAFCLFRWGIEVCAGTVLGYVSDRVGKRRAAVVYMAMGAAFLVGASFFLPLAVILFFASTGESCAVCYLAASYIHAVSMFTLPLTLTHSF